MTPVIGPMHRAPLAPHETDLYECADYTLPYATLLNRAEMFIARPENGHVIRAHPVLLAAAEYLREWLREIGDEAEEEARLLAGNQGQSAA